MRSRCSVSIGRASGTHIDAHATVGQHLRRQIAGHRTDYLDATAGLARQQIDDAASGVAAGSGLRTVRVADAHKGIDIGAFRCRLDRNELIAPHAGASIGDRRRAPGRQA
jgi:hypothetical protein